MRKNPFEDIIKAMRATKVEDAFMPLVNYVKDLEKANERYRKQIQDYSKDAEIVKKDEKIKSLSNELAKGFGITDDEWKAIREWQDEHIKEVHNGNSYSGAIGGRWTFEFIPTSLGDIGTIKCSCGAEYTFRELE